VMYSAQQHGEFADERPSNRHAFDCYCNLQVDLVCVCVRVCACVRVRVCGSRNMGRVAPALSLPLGCRTSHNYVLHTRAATAKHSLHDLAFTPCNACCHRLVALAVCES
jgi:hypothetical protein